MVYKGKYSTSVMIWRLVILRDNWIRSTGRLTRVTFRCGKCVIICKNRLKETKCAGIAYPRPYCLDKSRLRAGYTDRAVPQKKNFNLGKKKGGSHIKSWRISVRLSHSTLQFYFVLLSSLVFTAARSFFGYLSNPN